MIVGAINPAKKVTKKYFSKTKSNILKSERHSEVQRSNIKKTQFSQVGKIRAAAQEPNRQSQFEREADRIQNEDQMKNLEPEQQAMTQGLVNDHLFNLP